MDRWFITQTHYDDSSDQLLRTSKQVLRSYTDEKTALEEFRF